MTLKNTENSYGSIAKAFHWLMALTIIFMLALGLYMDSLEMSQQKLNLYGLHKSIGALILIAVTLRLLWRQLNIIPNLPDNMNKFERFGAHASHYLLYAFMFGMPLVGWLLSSAAGFPVSVFGWFTLPNLISPDRELVKLFGEIHELGGIALIGLIALHALAALFHHFVKKDDVLRRMMPALAILLFAGVANAEVTATKFDIMPAESSIKFEAVQNNSAVTGEFKTFTADINFNSEALDKSHVKVMVDMNSVSSAYDEVPLTLRGDEWFNIKLFPQAVFETKSFTKVEGNKYKADATLKIKDHEETVTLNFTLDEYNEAGATVTGETILKRTAFGIGWKDTSSVKDDVKVTIKLKAQAAK